MAYGPIQPISIVPMSDNHSVFGVPAALGVEEDRTLMLQFDGSSPGIDPEFQIVFDFPLVLPSGQIVLLVTVRCGTVGDAVINAFAKGVAIGDDPAAIAYPSVIGNTFTIGAGQEWEVIESTIPMVFSPAPPTGGLYHVRLFLDEVLSTVTSDVFVNLSLVWR